MKKDVSYEDIGDGLVKEVFTEEITHKKSEIREKLLIQKKTWQSAIDEATKAIQDIDSRLGKLT